MKHKLKFLSVVFLFAIFSLSSCTSSEDKAEAIAEEVFELYNNQDYDKIISISYKKLDLTSVYKTLNKTYGKIESYTKYKSYKPAEYDNKGFSFFYKCKSEKTKDNFYLSISIVEKDDEYVLISFEFSEDKDWIDNKHIYYANSTTAVVEYYASLKTNIDSVSKFLDKRIIDAGLEKNFINMLHEKREYFGKIITTSKLKSGSTMLDDGTHVIEIYTECKTDSITFYEKIDLVKSKNGSKIIDLNADMDLNKLN